MIKKNLFFKPWSYPRKFEVWLYDNEAEVEKQWGWSLCVILRNIKWMNLDNLVKWNYKMNLNLNLLISNEPPDFLRTITSSRGTTSSAAGNLNKQHFDSLNQLTVSEFSIDSNLALLG